MISKLILIKPEEKIKKILCQKLMIMGLLPKYGHQVCGKLSVLKNGSQKQNDFSRHLKKS